MDLKGEAEAWPGRSGGGHTAAMPEPPEVQVPDDPSAEFYNVLNPWMNCDDFYLDLVMSAESVLDVGCGTGTLLHRARLAGHTGRLCGLDPDPAMLNQARTRSDIEWILGYLSSVDWKQDFDLVVMTGHAFQVFIEDDELRSSLAAIRSALTDDGRFAFETRNPLVRTWESWNPDNPFEFLDSTGATVRVEYKVETPIEGDVVHVTETFSSADWDGPPGSRGSLRFLDVDSLSGFLSGAGLVVAEQFGDWDRSPLTDTSPEIITIARRG